MSDVLEKLPPLDTIPSVPDSLKNATWVPICEDWCTHQLDRATGIETGDDLVWFRKTAKPEQLYVAQTNEGEWYCAKCGEAVLGTRVAHPIWDGVFACSGGGDVEYEKAPYCPTCEKVPPFDGRSITRSR